MDTSLSEAELEASEIERADRSIFTQDALLNTLMAHDDDDYDEDDNNRNETKQAVRGRASPMQMPSQSSSPQPSSSALPPSAVTQSSSATATSSASTTSSSERPPKNGQNESQPSPSPPHQHSAAVATKPRAQLRTSPLAADRTTTSSTTTSGSSQQLLQQQRTMAQQPQPANPRIEYVLSPRTHQSSTGGTISVREVLVGSNYAAADTARRKPICTVDTLTQTTEPPTSH